jgi:hypothetical protein
MLDTMSQFRPPRSDITRPTLPEYLTAGGMDMQRIDDPLADRIWKGEPLLGWGGDNRLGLYLSVTAAKWCLVRYCEDRVLRVLAVRPADGDPMDAVGSLITFLVENDSRRGVNAAAEILAHNDRVSAAADAAMTDWLAEEGLPRAARRRLAAHG